jgi:succinyl-diaminopimelate desuccinylase
VGDVIKVGRRGSINIWMDVLGAQGHVAYPHLADNPATRLVKILARLKARVLDSGSEWFDASNLEITDIHIGNAATNVIPAKASARINIRFNNLHTGQALEQWVRAVIAEEAPSAQVRVAISGESFLTAPGDFSAQVQAAIADVTGTMPELSTSGGTSDARFITNYCPVLECGLVGQSMHKVDEAVAVEDIHQLTRIYERLLARYFA